VKNNIPSIETDKITKTLDGDFPTFHFENLVIILKDDENKQFRLNAPILIATKDRNYDYPVGLAIDGISLALFTLDSENNFFELDFRV